MRWITTVWPLALASCWGPIPEIAPAADIAAATGVEDVEFSLAPAPDAAPNAPIATVPGVRLELADALRRAVRGAPTLQASLARIRVALADARQARTLPNPLLGFVVRWGHGRPEIEATLTEAVLGILQAPRRARIADADLRRAAAEALTTALDVSAELQRRYTEAQATDRLVPWLEQRVALTDRLVAIAESRQRLGEAAASEVTAIAAQKLGLEAELATARLRQRDLRLQLARRIGEPLAAADWTLDDWRAPPTALGDEAAWLRSALAHRPELQAIGWRLAALDDERALARWSRWLDGELGVDAQRTPDWAVGPSVSLPLPLFDGGGAAGDRAAAERAAVEHELVDAVRGVCEDVRRALAAARGLADNLARVRDRLLPLQEQRRAQAQRAFELGELDLTAVLLADHDLLQTRADVTDLERDLAFARIQLERAAGGIAASTEAERAAPDLPTATER